MKVFLLLIFCISLAVLSCSRPSAPQESEGLSLSNMVEAQNYVFKANSAIPARGRTIQLSTDYYLIVRKDSIIGDLPFFGRAYTAPMGQSGGIEFTSTKFDYNKTEKKNGAYEIEIIPRDHNDVQRMFLTISKSGYGNLHVSSQNRQAISFNGVIVSRVR